MPPRYFWRRVGALATDYLIASIIAMLALLPFADEDRANIRFSPLFKMQTCGQANSLPQPLHDAVAPHSIKAAKVCKTYAYGVYNGLTATIVLHEDVQVRAGVTTTKRVSTQFDIDSQGNPVTPAPIHGPAAIGLIILLAAVTSAIWPGRSPGKKLFRIRISGPGLRPGRVALREALKWAPLLALVVIEFAVALALGGRTVLTEPLLIVFLVVVIIALAAYYILPFLRWRGAMAYDRLLGLRVDRGEHDAEESARPFE